MRKIPFTLLLAVFLALVLTACGGKEPDVSTFKDMSNEEIGVTIKYPPEWVTKAQPSEVGVAGMNFASSEDMLALLDSPSAGLGEGAFVTVLGMDKELLGFLAEEDTNMDDPADLVDLFAGLIMSDNPDDFTLTKEAIAVSLGSAQGAKAVYEVTGDKGKGTVQVVALPNKNVVVYVVTAVAEKSDEELAPLIEAMLGTLSLSEPTMAGMGDG